MHLEDVKDNLYDLVNEFFPNTEIIWSEQDETVPKLPYITLSVGDISRNENVLADDNDNRCYQASTIFEINLYTKGRPIEGLSGVYSNTATSDLTDFFNYIDSEYGLESQNKKEIVVLLRPPIRDLTKLLSDSKYRYRAMAEADVYFTIDVTGAYGMGGMKTVPNPSGGGTETMYKKGTDPIETIQIEEEETGYDE